MRSQHNIDPRRLLNNAITHLLSQAATHGDLHSWPFPFHGRKLTKIAKEASCRVLSNRAGINHDDVGPRIPGICSPGSTGRHSLNGNVSRSLE